MSILGLRGCRFRLSFQESVSIPPSRQHQFWIEKNNRKQQPAALRIWKWNISWYANSQMISGSWNTCLHKSIYKQAHCNVSEQRHLFPTREVVFKKQNDYPSGGIDLIKLMPFGFTFVCDRLFPGLRICYVYTTIHWTSVITYVSLFLHSASTVLGKILDKDFDQYLKIKDINISGGSYIKK